MSLSDLFVTVLQMFCNSTYFKMKLQTDFKSTWKMNSKLNSKITDERNEQKWYENN